MPFEAIDDALKYVGPFGVVLLVIMVAGAFIWLRALILRNERSCRRRDEALIESVMELCRHSKGGMAAMEPLAKLSKSEA